MQVLEKEIGLQNTWNAKNAARMQMDVDNSSASGTFSLPKPVCIIPIEIEIEKAFINRIMRPQSNWFF